MDMMDEKPHLPIWKDVFYYAQPPYHLTKKYVLCKSSLFRGVTFNSHKSTIQPLEQYSSLSYGPNVSIAE